MSAKKKQTTEPEAAASQEPAEKPARAESGESSGLSKAELEEIIGRLITKCIRTGEKLPTEKQLMDQYGVSRIMLREVLSIFEVNGFISSQRGSGRYAQSPNLSSQLFKSLTFAAAAAPSILLELLDVRSILEVNSLPQAIYNLTPEHFKQMQYQVNEMKLKASNGYPFSENDREFHRTLFSCTNNRLMEQLLTAFWDTYAFCEADSWYENSLEQASIHEKLLEYCIKRDCENATRTLQSQFTESRFKLVNLLCSY